MLLLLPPTYFTLIFRHDGHRRELLPPFFIPFLFSDSRPSRPLWTLLPNYRSPSIIQKNNNFLINVPTKAAVLSILTEGLRGDWGSLPSAGVPVTNFLKCRAAKLKCRERFKSEVQKGCMLAGPGWSAQIVHSALLPTGSLYLYALRGGP